MKTIIRIEHPRDGNGIWQATSKEGNWYYWSFSFRSSLVAKHNNFPTPDEDSLIDRCIEKDEFCAFKSIEQIQQWIDKSWWNEIFKAGFKVLMLDVSECVVGEYQILFKKENILQVKDISNLFK